MLLYKTLHFHDSPQQCESWWPGISTRVSAAYTDGLVQERLNSSALAMSYVFLALTHWYYDEYFHYSCQMWSIKKGEKFFMT